MLCSHPACCTILIEHCELLRRAQWLESWSVLQLWPEQWCLIDAWLLSSLVPRPHPAGWCLGTRLTPEYNYKKDMTDQSLPTWLAPPVTILTLYTRASMGFYNLIMLKMSHNLKRLIHLVGEVDTGFMLDQFSDNPHISLLGRHHESRLLRLLRSNDNSTINLWSRSSELPPI